MIFSQFIAAMEAYLSDKILRLAGQYPEIKRRIIVSADFMKDKNLKVAEVLLDPAKAENVFKIGLQQLLYHDLDKVEKIYQIALKSGFYPADPATKTELTKAILIRHDCVHRNGSDVSGAIHIFDREVIQALCDHVTALVEHIEQKAGNAVAALEKLGPYD